MEAMSLKGAESEGRYDFRFAVFLKVNTWYLNQHMVHFTSICPPDAQSRQLAQNIHMLALSYRLHGVSIHAMLRLTSRIARVYEAGQLCQRCYIGASPAALPSALLLVVRRPLCIAASCCACRLSLCLWLCVDVALLAWRCGVAS